jgi:hypothetical protein
VGFLGVWPGGLNPPRLDSGADEGESGGGEGVLAAPSIPKVFIQEFFCPLFWRTVVLPSVIVASVREIIHSHTDCFEDEEIDRVFPVVKGEAVEVCFFFGHFLCSYFPGLALLLPRS